MMMSCWVGGGTNSGSFQSLSSSSVIRNEEKSHRSSSLVRLRVDRVLKKEKEREEETS